MKQDFLFELGCEELPAGQIDGLISGLVKGFVAQLKVYGLGFDVSEIRTYATPRRLALLIPQLEGATQAQTLERRGPSKAQGFDASGQASRALLGFLQSVNAKLSDVYEVDTDKGTWLAIKVHKKSESVQDLLPVMLAEVLKTLPMKKPMRWGSHTFQFVRPVHWLVMLYGKEVIFAEAFGVKADRLSYGHRFLAPEVIKIKQPKDYEDQLFKAHVVVDVARRREMIETEALKLVAKTNMVRFNTLDEVVNLVEWPHAVLGQFDPTFLRVPREALISAMETHQRVFPVLDHDEKLKAEFITISNVVSKSMMDVKVGNEKVIAARLSDATFFYDVDVKVPLESHLEHLKKISFQEKLGSLLDKAVRVEILAGYLSGLFEVNKALLERAAHLCKCDLTTDMVQEFPELQGIMGREYALVQGEDSSVAYAIEDHYKPKARGGDLPREKFGALLAIADKMDTLVGLFGVGEKPSGSGDPYALRRQSLGVIAIIIQFQLSFDMTPLVRRAYQNYVEQGFKLGDAEYDLAEFLLERMAVWCVDEHPEISKSVVNAVKARMVNNILQHKNFLNLIEFFDNARDLNKMLNSSDGQELLQLVKRVGNIIPQDFDVKVLSKVYVDLKEPSEAQLISVLEKVRQDVLRCIEAKAFLDAYMLLLQFRMPLAQFFDEVTVMADDYDLKSKRLSLLHEIKSLFDLLADFNCL